MVKGNKGKGRKKGIYKKTEAEIQDMKKKKDLKRVENANLKFF